MILMIGRGCERVKVQQGRACHPGPLLSVGRMQGGARSAARRPLNSTRV